MIPTRRALSLFILDIIFILIIIYVLFEAFILDIDQNKYLIVYLIINLLVLTSIQSIKIVNLLLGYSRKYKIFTDTKPISLLRNRDKIPIYLFNLLLGSFTSLIIILSIFIHYLLFIGLIIKRDIKWILQWFELSHIVLYYEIIVFLIILIYRRFPLSIQHIVLNLDIPQKIIISEIFKDIPDNISEYITRLDDIMKNKKLYKNDELSVSILADSVGIDKQRLSLFINTHLRMSVRDFINRYRIEEAKYLLITEPDVSAENIARVCGFASKSVFYRYFKNICNCTPAEYRKINIVTNNIIES